INSALQRARSTLASRNLAVARGALSNEQSKVVERYVDAFLRYDVDALVSLLHDDATFSMPPFSLWLQGPANVRAWLLGRGSVCRDSRLVPLDTSGAVGFAQYHRAAPDRYDPWAVVVLELQGERIASWSSFLDKSLFPRFGLAPHLSARSD
ncbi:MAG: nuclear transport factor 2 family protein, partial [Archangium sp.]|nr:nuclear transport factor 2 family protein [Archangium sp.]